MPVHPTVEAVYHRLTDFFFARRPQPVPAADRLAQCKIISHRGEHDNRRIMENTLPAFEQAAAAGVWGIECDVRWTKDAVPVVLHDPDLTRLFRIDRKIEQVTFRELRAGFGSVPSLSEVVSRFGGRLHLMIEIKACSWPGPQRQNRTLAEALTPLEPIKDYHIMSLTPFQQPPLPFLPSQALLAIAYFFPDHLSHWVIKNEWGGLCGHYLLMRAGIINKHLYRGQQVGTGFVNSRNCLFREINRGVQWLFSNRALVLQRILQRVTANG
jgi:glycerophosphoryl diester phosphodiesterase